jgi:hypothetical protein
VVGRYVPQGTHAFACGVSKSTGEYLAANLCAADSVPRAQAGRAKTNMTTSRATIKR